MERLGDSDLDKTEFDKGAAAPTCTHPTTTRSVVSTIYFKREFSAEVEVCVSCGHHWWTIETQGRFQEWLARLKHDRRDVFQLQFYMPDPARQSLREVVKTFPGVPSSSLIRAMTSVYLSALIRLPNFRQDADRVFEQNSYRQITLGPRKKTSLQFGPIALLDIQAWGNILKLPPHKVVEDAIYKTLALKNETDPDLREYWSRDLWPQIELILRSV